MQLENTFTVAAPLGAVWDALQDPQAVAPCFPGATLTEFSGDSFIGQVKIKVGPISMNYSGKGTYLERDDAQRRVVIDARGRDARGQGTAAAIVTGTLSAAGADKTEVTMSADVNITGKAAQFGRGVITEIADRIIGQFADRLAHRLSAETPATSQNAAAPRLVTERAEDDESLNLLSAVAGPMLKSALPVVGIVAVLAVVGVVVLRRSQRPQ